MVACGNNIDRKERRWAIYANLECHRKRFWLRFIRLIERYNPEKELVVANFVYLNPERPIFGPMKLIVKTSERNGMTDG